MERPPIRLNAFAMACVGHLSPGLWTHPRDRAVDYADLGYWTGLARTLERGRFDGIFIADVLGVYDVYAGSGAASLRAGAQVPILDPTLLVPAMAHVTEHLGFGVTVSLTYEQPYPFARRMSTLDHLTKGRVGWNIVTSYLDSAARGVGRAAQAGHDQRYDAAEEYMEVVYRLWEGSWADDAAVRDRGSMTYARPERVRPVRHRGEGYAVDAVHLCEPSPQRTPVLYQAGASSKGRDFAARHAECVFVSGPSARVLAPRVADLRRRAEAAGRGPDALTVFALATVVTAPTDEEARAKFEDYAAHVDTEGALALLSGWTGIDFAAYGLDEPLRAVENDAMRTAVDNFTTADPGRVWTPREMARFAGIGGVGPVFVGGPGTIADALEAYVGETGVDGFNLAYAVTPEGFEDFVDLVVPELQRRGRHKREYAPGTLREKLRGRGPRLEAPHPAAAWRFGDEGPA